jgi:hypothetical protein
VSQLRWQRGQRPNLIMEDKAIFDHVNPGQYALSIDGKTWTAIVVASTPLEQTVTIERKE